MIIEAMKFVVLILVSIIQGSSAVQTWQEEPTYTEVNPGESAILACKIFNKKGNCSWQKDGKPQGMFTGKIEWAGDQNTGDCSLRVFDASEMDDGEWECQVTASSFSAHDALTSQIANLVVRVAPDAPLLEIGSSQLQNNFTVREQRPGVIKCISRYGNPPSRIKWFLGSEELPSSSYNQSNVTEVDRPKTFSAVSTLRASFMKADHGRSLRCVSVHEAYPTKSKDVSIALDVQYSPTVTLQGAPTGDIEEGKDKVGLQCLADANPPANIIWKRIGDDNVFSFQETVEFNPATRKHSGTYTCKASNTVGVSDPLSVRLDIKYPPKILEVGPEQVITAALNNSTKLQCQAKGNPAPSYEWIQVMQTTRKVRRGSNATLEIENVTYEHQGQYFCIAYNVIKGTRNDDYSKPVDLEVVGAPQVLRYQVERHVEVQRGDDALISMLFCSDPEPSRTTWEWGSIQLDAGHGSGRHVAERLAKESGSPDCYQARLRVQHVDMTDARNYYLSVKNDRGEDKYSVALTVKEPVTMTTVIGIVITCLVILVIFTIGVFYAFKTERCCFSQRGDFKTTTDIENNKNDIETQKNQHGRPRPIIVGGKDVEGTLVAGTLSSIPPDAIYLGSQKRAHSSSLAKYSHEYENIKALRAAMGTRPTLMATTGPSRSSSSSNSSSTQSSSIHPHTWGRKDEPTLKQERGPWHTESSKSKLGGDFNQLSGNNYPADHRTSTIGQFSPDSDNSPTFRVPPRGFSAPTGSRHFQNNNNNIPSADKDINFYGPTPRSSVGARERFEPGANSPRRQANNVVYAELQLPRASTNDRTRGGRPLRGSGRGGIWGGGTAARSGVCGGAPLGKTPQRTQYAEITFQRDSLQSAHI